MLEPQTYEMSDDEVWEQIEKAVEKRDAFLVMVLANIVAD